MSGALASGFYWIILPGGQPATPQPAFYNDAGQWLIINRVGPIRRWPDKVLGPIVAPGDTPHNYELPSDWVPSLS